MRTRWDWPVALVAAFALTTAAPAGAAVPPPAGESTDPLRADLDRILQDPRLDGAHAGVVVRDPATGRVLYDRAAGERATPASTAKLATAAAALDTLGADYRFRTALRTGAERRGAVLDGDLHLRGTGDPTMLEEDYDRLAAEFASTGVRRVRGRLIGDDTWFDDQRLGTGWAWEDESEYYAAPISALTVAANTDYDAGSVKVHVAPRAEGLPAQVRTEPDTDVVDLVNRTETVPAGGDATVDVDREHGSDSVVVSGTVPVDAPETTELVSVPDPTAYAVGVLRDALERHGIRVEGGTASGPTPPGTRRVARHDSMPLRDLLVPFLKLSNNGHAEVLVKAMGRAEKGEGSWDAGLAVVGERLAELGVAADQVRLVDGSGLSAMNAISPGQLAALLDAARERPWYSVWRRALPVAGVQERMVGGTLRDRMGGTAAEGAVRAKTGSLTGVSTLSGYVTTARGRDLVFAVMLNDFVTPQAPTEVEDAIAVRLAEYGGERDRHGRRASPAGSGHRSEAVNSEEVRAPVP